MKIVKFYKYLSINRPECWQYRRQLIADRKLYFSDPTNFNDPLDCNIAAAAKLKGMLYKCKIFCLSKDNCNDFLMFAHYSDGHRGFRLTFEVDEDMTLGEIGVLGRGRGVVYVPKLPDDFDTSNIHLSLFMKLDAWKYEAEYRILAAQVDQIEYDENSLIEVAFGCRMNPDFEPVIRKWVFDGGHKRVKFLKVKLSKRPEGYEYEEI